MINRRLFVVVILLVPLAVFSLFNNEEEQELPKENLKIEETPIINIRLKLTETEEVIHIPLEEYLIGVVAAEMPALFHEEALKAQAIASRSFVLSRVNPNRDFDVVDTTDVQVFINEDKMRERWGREFNTYYERIKNSVRTTENMVLVYDEEIIPAYFFAMSNGHTEYVELVFGQARNFLKSVESVWDNSSLRNFDFEVKIPRREFCEKLSINCSNLKVEEPIRSKSNRVNEIKVNNTTFRGTDFRRKLGLRSTDFDIDVRSENVYITTRGHGHGVGMSQWGANGMAKEGKNYQEILKHYYQNVEIKNLNNV